MSNKIEVISPVYFDGSSLRKDRNINTIFTSGFDLFSTMNQLNMQIADKYFRDKKNNDDYEKENFKAYQKLTIKQCAETYAKANIFDLVVQTMNAYKSEVTIKYDNAIIVYFGNDTMERLKDILNDRVRYFNCINCNNKSNYMAQLYGTLDGVNIYNEIYFNVFEYSIVDCMNRIVGNTARILSDKNSETLVDYIYKMVYKDCYGDDSNIDLNISIQLKYNFISSILREIMNKYMGYLAVGINAILYNAGLMALYQVTDSMNNVLDIKYKSVDDSMNIDWSEIKL